MKKRAIIELTALLDVVLILLFMFIFNVSASQENLEQSLHHTQNSNQQLLAELKEKNQQLEQIQKERQDVEQLVKSLSSFLQMQEDELFSIINDLSESEQKKFIETLDPWLDEKQIIQELLQYQTLQSFFYTIHIGLKSGENELWINNQPTGITISVGEIQNPENYEKKKKQIMASIEKEIQRPSGEANRILLSLSLLDEEVYQYAYEITWYAITEIENKYGPQRIFKSEQRYISR
ncbi:MAG: hypothetical protein GX238_02825 [Epulopiscium sp.]|nr:hypothetical protein [Candidatus Epulonipiscium sp.]